MVILLYNTVWASGLNINAREAIVFDRNSKRILYEKNIDKKVPNASTTKVLTAIVAFENGRMTDVVKISKKAAMVNGSTIGLRTGDEITVNDLMKGMLICSGNDAATAIAEYVGGSVENFCSMMNKKAMEIGAFNTHFVTPHGLDREEHYSTAYDLAIISDYALNIPYLAEIFSKKSDVITVNGNTKNIRTTNEMLSVFPGADGLKTGYTGDAGRCLITSATRDDWQIISVVLGCDTKNNRTQDSSKLLSYAFEEYKLVKINDLIKSEFVIYVSKSKKGKYQAFVVDKFFFPLTSNETKELVVKYDVMQRVDATEFSDCNIGTVRVFLNDKEICELGVEISEEIHPKNMFDFFDDIFEMFLKCSQRVIEL